MAMGSEGCRADSMRAEFINDQLDLMCLDKLVCDQAALTRYSTVRIIEESGSQGVENLMRISVPAP
jgi:hypothetical protein